MCIYNLNIFGVYNPKKKKVFVVINNIDIMKKIYIGVIKKLQPDIKLLYL